MGKNNTWLVFPCHEESSLVLNGIIRGLGGCPARVLVVDDFSTPPYSPGNESVTVIRNSARLGKGASILKALEHISGTVDGHDAAVVTADADGQHSVEDILRVLERWRQVGGTRTIVSGSRDFSLGSPPLSSRLGRLFSSALVRIETGSYFPDTQNGLRAYPLGFFGEAGIRSRGFGFETETLVSAMRLGYDIEFVPIGTIYPSGRKSRFRKLADTFWISMLHARLLFWRGLRKRG